MSEAETAALEERVSGLPFGEVIFQGYVARRRAVEFGLGYDLSSRRTSAAEALPDFLMPVRDRAAEFAGLEAEQIGEAIVMEYPPGAPMGWHRDGPQFETIVGVSLGAACWMQLRPYAGTGEATVKTGELGVGKTLSLMLRPGSIYVMSGVSRWRFQHSIVAVDELRYSITFRTLRAQ